MNTGNKMEEKIWMYIDDQLPSGERSTIGQLIENDAAWKSKYNELLEVSRLLSDSELDAPSLRFTRNVMEEITRLHIAPATQSYINKRIIWGIGLFFITMLVGIIGYGIAQLGTVTGEESQISRSLDKVDFSRLFSNTWVNIFMMVNVVLGLILLDHYLANKRKKIRQQKIG